MKKFILFIALVAGSFFYSNAQLSIHLNANLGLQPIWAPVGYDHADYYYMPDIETYYSVSRHQYVYQNGGRWTYSSNLPYRYRNFDIYHAHKVVMNGDDRPYMHHAENRGRYAQFRGRHDQQIIRDSHENKYFENRNHPQHNEWKRDNHDNGNRGGDRRDDHRGNDNRNDHDNRRG